MGEQQQQHRKGCDGINYCYLKKAYQGADERGSKGCCMLYVDDGHLFVFKDTENSCDDFWSENERSERVWKFSMSEDPFLYDGAKDAKSNLIFQLSLHFSTHLFPSSDIRCHRKLT